MPAVFAHAMICRAADATFFFFADFDIFFASLSYAALLLRRISLYFAFAIAVSFILLRR